MAVQAARLMGARVTLVSRTEHRRRRGLDMGAHSTFDIEQAAEALRESGPYTVLLECAGVPLDPLMEPKKALLERFARAALVAGRSRVEYNFLWASMLRVSFHQSTHFDAPTLERVTALAASGQLALAALIDEVLPIDSAVEIYDRLRDDPMSVGGTVFDWY